MSQSTHENRFVALLQFAAGDAEVVQELSIPRKARRLDAVYRFDAAPVWFGAMTGTCTDRMVIFEHESSPLARHTLASALLGQAWMAWERVRPPTPRRTSKPALRLIGETLRPPIVIVVADRVVGTIEGAVPGLRATDTPGLWQTPHLDEGGLVLLDTPALRAQDGFAWWSWVGRPQTAEEGRTRLLRLLDDEKLPTLYKDRLMEAVMENEVPITEPEKESVYQRLKRQLVDEGRQAGLRDGRRTAREDERHALLKLVKRVAPDTLPRMQEIEEIEVLRVAVEDVLAERTKE